MVFGNFWNTRPFHTSRVYRYAFDENFGGDLDYGPTYFWNNLNKLGPLRSVEDADATPSFLKFPGNKLYNIQDAANYLWGASGAAMGHSKWYITSGTNLFSRFIHDVPDTSADLNAISDGYNLYKEYIGPLSFWSLGRWKNYSKPSWIDVGKTTCRKCR